MKASVSLLIVALGCSCCAGMDLDEYDADDVDAYSSGEEVSKLDSSLLTIAVEHVIDKEVKLRSKVAPLSSS
jgi:hypothetical protein